MKKILALAIVAVMAFACVFSASAAEFTMPDLDCTKWWTHDPANQMEIKEGTTVIKYTSTTNASCADTNFYHVPSVLLYTSDDGKMGTAGYYELWVNRGDNYGWTVPQNDVTSGYYNAELNAHSGADALATVGITWTSTFAEGFVWENWIPTLKQGAACEVTIVREGDVITMTQNVADLIVSTVTLPVPADEGIWISLTGDGVILSGISGTYTAPAVEDPAPTGDLIVLPIALMCISAGAVLTLGKKK
ncbi:MAG: hypothetical protein IJ448_06915 [Oscillospiraceae bacterium]|nr:hypothetical protein [Oscillospiraceae bacterium]